MERYLYRGSALGFAALMRRPYEETIPTLAGCVLSELGGATSAREEKYNFHDLISFSSAATEITGQKTPDGAYETITRVTVENLNVEDVLTADSISMSITSLYRDGEDKPFIFPDASYQGMKVRGEPVEPKLDLEFAHDPNSYRPFRLRYHEDSERCGVIYTRLSQERELVVENFGRIYFAEWQVSNYWQKLTLLRLKLGSPQEGDDDVGSGEGGGTPYP